MNTIDDFRPDAVVVDAGTFPTDARALHWLDVCDRIVCCDGAANDFIARGFRPWRIVGDCDSLAPDIRREYADIVRRIPEQESNDQTKAVRYLADHALRRIVILGATGRREDHTLGNISLLVDYLRQGIEARIYTDFGVFIPVHGHIRVNCEPGTQVSIFNLGARGLHSTGLRYPLYDFSQLWQGTLNECPGTEFSITADGYFLLYLAYHP